MKTGDIVKYSPAYGQAGNTHYVVGIVSADGRVAYGYAISDRTERRLEVCNYEVVYSTNESIIST